MGRFSRPLNDTSELFDSGNRNNDDSCMELVGLWRKSSASPLASALSLEQRSDVHGESPAASHEQVEQLLNGLLADSGVYRADPRDETMASILESQWHDHDDALLEPTDLGRDSLLGHGIGEPEWMSTKDAQNCLLSNSVLDSQGSATLAQTYELPEGFSESAEQLHRELLGQSQIGSINQFPPGEEQGLFPALQESRDAPLQTNDKSQDTLNRSPRQLKHVPRQERRPARENHRASIKSALRRAFAMVEDLQENHWARDFIFDRSPQAAAQVFTNQVALPYAVSSELFNTMIETEDKCGGAFDRKTHFQTTFVPAFSAGSLTVGAVVHRNVTTTETNLEDRDLVTGKLRGQPESPSSPATSPTGDTTFAVGRFVRDAKTGRMLVIKHSGSSSSQTPVKTIVSYTNLQTTKRLENDSFVCDGLTFSQGKVLNSVQVCATSRNARFCPDCSAPPSVRCCSVEPIRWPSHALDFTGDIEAMSRYPGEFTGTCNAIAVVPKGSGHASPTSEVERSYFSASLATNARVSGYARQDLRHKDLMAMFQLFVVQLSIADRSPLLAVMPPADYGSDEDTDAPGNLLVPLELRKGRSTGASEAVERVHSPTRAESGGDVSVLNIPTIVESVARGTSGQIPIPVLTGPCTVTGEDCSHDDVGHCEIQATWPQKTRREATSAIQSTQLRSLPPHEPLDREMRRKLKNRRSAARSNARKREQMTRLKANLEVVRRRASELLVLEDGLRTENLTLRKCLLPLAQETVVD